MIKIITKRQRQLETMPIKKNVLITNITNSKEVKKQEQTKEEKKPSVINNNTHKNKKEKMNSTDLEKATNIVDSMNDSNKSVKRIKNEKGLIERVDINKVVLTEDNKMLLKD